MYSHKIKIKAWDVVKFICFDWIISNIISQITMMLVDDSLLNLSLYTSNDFENKMTLKGNVLVKELC